MAEKRRVETSVGVRVSRAAAVGRLDLNRVVSPHTPHTALSPFADEFGRGSHRHRQERRERRLRLPGGGPRGQRRRRQRQGLRHQVPLQGLPSQAVQHFRPGQTGHREGPLVGVGVGYVRQRRAHRHGDIETRRHHIFRQGEISMGVWRKTRQEVCTYVPHLPHKYKTNISPVGMFQ